MPSHYAGMWRVPGPPSNRCQPSSLRYVTSYNTKGTNLYISNSSYRTCHPIIMFTLCQGSIAEFQEFRRINDNIATVALKILLDCSYCCERRLFTLVGGKCVRPVFWETESYMLCPGGCLLTHSSSTMSSSSSPKLSYVFLLNLANE